MSTLQYSMQTTLGRLYIVASEKGLEGLHFEQQVIPMVSSLRGNAPEIKFIAQTVRHLTDYLAGKPIKFNLPLNLKGTPFQKTVWGALREIPYGKTRSYRDLAISLGKPKAFRAVGNANGKNPIGVLIPCHRVIASDGSLGGYSGGLGIKKKLLALEGLRHWT